MLKFRGFSRFIWDLIHGCKKKFSAPTHTVKHCLWEREAGTEEGSHRGESNLLPTQLELNMEAFRFFILKRFWKHGTLMFQSAIDPAANAHELRFFFLRERKAILFGTGTQRGVATGLSRGRNLRSKIWWFTEFCNSHYVSHFAAFFIVAGTKISVAKSCFALV